MGGLQVEVGVLALQGAFAAHQSALSECGIQSRQVRVAEDLEGLSGLILPGGESTTMSNLLLRSGLFAAVKEGIGSGLHVFGTCAGMILLARQVSDGRDDQVSFGAMDISVQRNAYGRQVDSFETDIEISGLDAPFHAVFIRAPRVSHLGSNVEVLATFEDSPVLVAEGNCIAAAFHPELSLDSRVHQIFVNRIENAIVASKS
jgi:5'-phosphate synthase pdxT subunit